MTDAQAMQRALDLAHRGWGRVHPNPMVGAVVVGSDGIVGEGFHAELGGPHAEVVALAAAGPRARDATLVVTLEPCRHAGKQPPCIDAVLASGVRRVVIGALDPTTAGGGAELLGRAGLEVDTGLLADRAERQNGIFFHASRPNRRPYVAVKLATSIDHRIADAAGHSRWISGDDARDFVHWHRAGFDAIGVGGKTAVIDDPSLTVRGSLDPRRPPRRVVFAGTRRLSLDLGLVRTAGQVPTTVVTASPASPDAAALRHQGVEVIGAATLVEGLERLREAGVRSILFEGGGRLTGSLLADGLVDRFALIVCPVWLGDHGVPATRGLDVPSLLDAERWTLADRKGLGQDTLLVFDRR